MPPWGVASGKGVLNQQGIDDVVNYVESIQISSAKAKERFTKQLVDARATNPGKSDGELLFQLQCARCHTKNWSFYDPANPGPGPLPGPQGGGAFGPNLTGGDTVRQFAGPTGVQDHIDWVTSGKPANEAYGTARDLVRPHAPLRQHPDQGADPGHRRLRAGPVMHGSRKP